MLKNCRSLTLNRNHSSLQKLLLFLRQNISDQEEKSQKERERENQALPNMAWISIYLADMNPSKAKFNPIARTKMNLSERLIRNYKISKTKSNNKQIEKYILISCFKSS
jgi:hypothetical protein